MKTDFKLTREMRQNMIREVQEFFSVERDEDIGNLAASKVVDLFTDELAKFIYNQAISDAYKYMTERVEDVLTIQKY